LGQLVDLDQAHSVLKPSTLIVIVMSTTLALILALVAAHTHAHPAALKCMNDTQTATAAADVFRVGAQIMGVSVTSEAKGVNFTLASNEAEAGGVVDLKVTSLPNGAYYAVRASSQAGAFTPLTAAQALTTDCPSQIYSTQGVDENPKVEWTAPWAGVDAGQVSPAPQLHNHVRVTTNPPRVC